MELVLLVATDVWLEDLVTADCGLFGGALGSLTCTASRHPAPGVWNLTVGSLLSLRLLLPDLHLSEPLADKPTIKASQCHIDERLGRVIMVRRKRDDDDVMN
jgi:hypothetical protein